MFAVIYRSYISKELENRYQKAWRLIASYFVEEKGALGSTLHKTKEGLWIAYSKWPDENARDAAWSDQAQLLHPPHILQAIEELKSCLDDKQKFEPICMEVVDSINC